MSFTLIENPQDLDILSKELLEKSYIGIDTEFKRRSKQDITLALMQINDGYEIYLIDCISIGEYQGSCGFLNDKRVLKIFHSCREDIEVINSWTNEELVNIFDTQLANAFLGGSFSIGYQKLVKQELDVTIHKGETRSNWVRRPLRDAQLKYAVSDVEFLLDLYEKQVIELEKLGKLDWMGEEINLLSNNTEYEKEGRSSDIKTQLTKSEELIFLRNLNQIIIELSESLQINKTLLFSKRSQREFFRLCLNKGVEEAYRILPQWKKELLLDKLSILLKEFN